MKSATITQQVLLHDNDVSLYIRREDLMFPEISGNKFRKLKYNLLETQKKSNTILTFGGAFSNHIAATAAAGEIYGLKTIGVVRGEELIDMIDENPTLEFAKRKGMVFEFVTREQYRDKESPQFLEYLKGKYGDIYILPEGGTNLLAVKGCEEILTENDVYFDYVCCAVGTGGTIAGIINASKSEQKVIGFPVLKGSFLQDDIRRFAKKENWKLIEEYVLGGYGKVSSDFVHFLNDFYKQTKIPLDPVYTGKMMYGVMDLISKGYFEDGSKILCVHTGGLQGIKGMNQLLKKKKMPQIEY